MNILLWIILGAIAGWIATKIMGLGERNWIRNIFIGIVGALVGGFVMNLIGGRGITGFDLYSIFVAVIGSVITLYVINRM